MPPFGLIVKNLFKHKIRSLLTVGSIAIAIFLLCLLRSLVVSLDAGVRAAASNRLIVQSSVSLFVYLPESYTSKLSQIEGVENVSRWNWFGGHYQDPSNFFGQMATDASKLLDMYPEMELVEGSREDFEKDRTSCIIGKQLVDRFGFKLGQQIPIIGTTFSRTDKGTWDFRVAGIYRATKPNVDQGGLFFHYDLLQKAVETGETDGPKGVGWFVIQTKPGANQTAVMSEIDAMFQNGPQRVQSTTESEFQSQFLSMMGNIPFFISAIGGGVLVAILLASLNTMLMAAREQTRDVGVLKALGFTDGAVFAVMLTQSLVLCGIGGFSGLAVAKLTEPFFIQMLGTFFPGYRVTNAVLLLGAGLTLLTGFVAGIAPALSARRQSVITALRATA